MTASKMSESLVSAHCSSFGMLPSGGTCTFVSPAPIALSKSFLYHRKSDHQACRQSSNPLHLAPSLSNSLECSPDNQLVALSFSHTERAPAIFTTSTTHVSQTSCILQDKSDMLSSCSGLHPVWALKKTFAIQTHRARTHV